MARIKKAQGGDKVNPLTYLESSRKRAKAVTDSSRAQELKKGILTYDDYLKSKIKEKPVNKQRNGGKTSIKKAQGGKKVRLKEDSRAYITKVKTDDKGNVTSLKSRRTVKGLLSGAPRSKKIMKAGGKIKKK